MSVAVMLPFLVGATFILSAVALLKKKKWAWTMSFVLQFVGIAFSLVLMASEESTRTFSLIGYAASIALSGTVIGYLNTPDVKEYLGRVAQPSSSDQARTGSSTAAATTTTTTAPA